MAERPRQRVRLCATCGRTFIERSSLTKLAAQMHGPSNVQYGLTPCRRWGQGALLLTWMTDLSSEWFARNTGGSQCIIVETLMV
jgi:hypothetical protein